MKQQEQSALSDVDAERIGDMANRFEMAIAWGQLCQMLVLGYAVPRPKAPFADWRSRLTRRCYPIARDRSQELVGLPCAAAMLTSTTGRPGGVFTVPEVKVAQARAIDMLKVFTPRVEA